jgi:excisionase family DNA binding protein
VVVWILGQRLGLHPLEVVSDIRYTEVMDELLKGYLTTTEAGERSGIDPSTLRRMIKAGKLEGVKAGRNWFVATASLDHYAAHSGQYRARKRRTNS